jgi:amino acid adenylation domain-containing protein/non-ribosomal peptide synthase protein (TIGR01720 family)
MIPGVFIHLDALPVTVSGKINRLALPEPEFRGDAAAYREPVGELETLLSDVWSRLLGLPRVGTRDDFFRIGGDSILSIQLTSRLRSRNLHVTVRDIFECRTIERLAKVITGEKDVTIAAEQKILEGSFDLLPVQQWFFEKKFKRKNHFNQSILFKTRELSIEPLRNAITALVAHHDALRITFNGEGKQCYNPHIALPDLKCLDLYEISAQDLPRILSDWQSGFDIKKGPLWQFGYIKGYPDGSARIFAALHHLIEDTVSLRILMEDILDLYEGGRLPAKTSSYRQWVAAVKEYAREISSELPFWQAQIGREDSKVKYGPLSDAITRQEVCLSKEKTAVLLYEASGAYLTEINDLLLCALAYALREWHGSPESYITLEGHGREDVERGLDVSRTVGWFTTLFPVRLMLSDDLPETIKKIKKTLRSIPNKGLGYGALKYYGNDDTLRKHKLPPIVFNYLGRLAGNNEEFGFVLEDSGMSVHPDNHLDTLININAFLVGGELVFRIAGRLGEEDMARLSASLISHLSQIADHCHDRLEKGEVQYSPSDFSTVNISQELLDRLQKQYALEAIFPASSLQEGFVFHALSSPDDDAYRIQMVFDYLDGIDPAILRRAWEAVAATCPALRLCFNWDEGIIQIIDRDVHLDWSDHDIRHESDQEARLLEILEQDRRQGFDLARPGLLRLHLIRRSAAHFTCIKTVHHSISDGWSTPIELAKVHDVYQRFVKNEKVDIREDTVYLTAQEYYHRNREEVARYWEEQLRSVRVVNDLNDLLSVRTDLDSIKTIADDRELSLEVDQEICENLEALVRQEGLTWSVILQFAWHKLLETYTGDQQTIVGTIVSGRDIPVAGIENSVGLYINTLPLTVSWEEKTVRKQLQDIHAGIVALNHYSHVHLAGLQKEGRRLFHSLFVFENYPKLATTPGEGVSITFRPPLEKLDYPIGVLVSGAPEELRIKLKYAGEYIKAEKVQRLLEQMQIILKQLPFRLDSPCHAITIVSDEERELLVNQWNRTAVYDKGSMTIQEAFSRQVRRTPGHIALRSGEQALTYEELNILSNRLAHLIRKRYRDRAGVELPRDTLIGLYMERSLEMIIGVLAVLKAGGAYVPFDTTEPAERLRYKISDCGCPLVITSSALMENLQRLENGPHLLALDSCKAQLEAQPATSPDTINLPEDLAYVIYTSGTTGKPKGSLVTHNNVIRLFHACDRHFKFTDSDVWTLFHSISFDFTVWEIWGALLYGGTLVIPSFEETRDTALFYDLLLRQKVTVLNQTPSAFAMLRQFDSEQEGRLSSLRYVIFGGEALNVQFLQGWINKYGMDRPELINMYGITETTVHVTYKRLTKEDVERDVSNIGRPLADLTLYVVDDRLQLVPVGVFGELYVGGAGVCRGYLGRPELTAERFVPNPFSKEEEKRKGANLRLYKTGDLARWLPSGDLEYKGRNDHQIKIRGFRIELGEIERKILEHPSVGHCVVTVHDIAESRKLVAYYTARADVTSQMLRDHVATLLPGYMVPSFFIEIGMIPLTVNGKIDHRALPVPELCSGDTDHGDPRDDIEAALCHIWAQVLGLPKVGIYDNFFIIGGDSIISIKVVGRLKAQGFDVSVLDLFRYSTIASLRSNIKSTAAGNETIHSNVVQWEF